MSEFQPGEVVDITIKGARVKERVRHGDGNGDDLRFTYEALDGEAWPSCIWADAPGVTVEHVAPAEWPPRPGDIWGSTGGGRWFAAQYFADFDDKADFAGCNDGGWRVVLVPMGIGPYGDTEARPDEVRLRQGRMTLVHREEVLDAG